MIGDGSMVNPPGKRRNARRGKGSPYITLYVPGLAPETRAALEAAPNRSEFVRRALEEHVSRAGERRELAEIRAALGRIEARLAAGGAAPAPGCAAPPGAGEADADAEALALLAGAFGKLTGGM